MFATKAHYCNNILLTVELLAGCDLALGFAHGTFALSLKDFFLLRGTQLGDTSFLFSAFNRPFFIRSLRYMISKTKDGVAG